MNTNGLPVEKLQRHVTQHPYPLLFATLSGAHLYGFPSRDSDFDLRGVHQLPLESVVGLDAGEQTVEKEGVYDGVEIDLVTHEIAKFFRLLLKRNGYVLEQVYSPIVLHSTEAHRELKAIAQSCITRHHAHHYLGFARTQWRLFHKESPHRVKPLLYVFRVLLTGVHLMRTGRIEANLPALNADAKLIYLDELMAQKTEGTEKGELATENLSFFETEYQRLTAMLEEAKEESQLPEVPNAKPQLNDLLVRMRLGNASR